jgi:hypothetical protein
MAGQVVDCQQVEGRRRAVADRLQVMDRRRLAGRQRWRVADGWRIVDRWWTAARWWIADRWWVSGGGRPTLVTTLPDWFGDPPSLAGDPPSWLMILRPRARSPFRSRRRFGCSRAHLVCSSWSRRQRTLNSEDLSSARWVLR